jgi:NADH-quinone oxidoreductase subunit E
METAKEQVPDKEPLKQLLESRGNVSFSDLIPLLQEIQEIYGYLPPKILTELSKQTGIPVSRIYGVATFYEQFHMEPHGKHTIRCCRGTACHVKGGPDIIKSIQENLDVKPGGTTEDMLFTFETVACLGTCFLAPVVMIDDDYYGHLTGDKIKKILKQYK